MGTKDFALFSRQPYCLLQLRVFLFSLSEAGAGVGPLPGGLVLRLQTVQRPRHASGKLLALEELQVLTSCLWRLTIIFLKAWKSSVAIICWKTKAFLPPTVSCCWHAAENCS